MPDSKIEEDVIFKDKDEERYFASLRYGDPKFIALMNTIRIAAEEDGESFSSSPEDDETIWLTTVLIIKKSLLRAGIQFIRVIQDGDQDRLPDEIREDRDKNQDVKDENNDHKEGGRSMEKNRDETQEKDPGTKGNLPEGGQIHEIQDKVQEENQGRPPDETKRRNQDRAPDEIQEEDPGANGNLPEGEQIQENQDRSPDEIRRDRDRDKT